MFSPFSPTLSLRPICAHTFFKTKRKIKEDYFTDAGGKKNLVHASVPSNTFAIYGTGEDKELTELVPGILNQLGPDSLASLRKLAESYQSLKKDGSGGGGEGGNKKGEDDDDDDDDIPDLVEGENFESKVEWFVSLTGKPFAFFCSSRRWKELEMQYRKRGGEGGGGKRGGGVGWLGVGFRIGIEIEEEEGGGCTSNKKDKI